MSLVGLEIKGLAELDAKLAKLPRFAVDAAADEAAKYMLEVLKEQPPPKYVSRKAAYGRTFQSDRQRRWFFANEMQNKIPYRRTQALHDGWKIVGSGASLIIANEEEAAVWTMDDRQQARQPAMVGWKKVGTIFRERMRQVIRHAEAGIKKAMRKAGIK